MSDLKKDRSVIDTVAALRTRLGDELMIVDHWEADLTTLGVARSDNPKRVVYFSTWDRSPNRYYVDLQFPPKVDSDHPYEEGERFDDVGFEELVAIAARHLGLEESPPSRLRQN